MSEGEKKERARIRKQTITRFTKFELVTAVAAVAERCLMRDGCSLYSGGRERMSKL